MVFNFTFSGGLNKSWECTAGPVVESSFTELKLNSTIEIKTGSAFPTDLAPN